MLIATLFCPVHHALQMYASVVPAAIAKCLLNTALFMADAALHCRVDQRVTTAVNYTARMRI